MHCIVRIINTLLKTCLLTPWGSLCHFFVCIILISLPITGQSTSSEHKVLIAYQKSQGFSQQLINNLQQDISKAGYQIDLMMLSPNKLNLLEAEKHQLIIAVGSKATKTLLDANFNPPPILSILMPRYLANKLRKLYPEKENWSSLLIDQPVERQFQLITSIIGKHQKTGVLIGPYTKDLKKTLQNNAQKSSHILTTEYVKDTEHLTSSLKKLTHKARILLTLPDPVIYNKNTIRGILLLSYRKKLPVIGFSKAYVKAGAIAAIYSQPYQISKQTTDIIQNFFKNGIFKHKEYHPEDFSVALNKKVAHSLGIHLPEKSIIIRKIKMAEKIK